MKKNFLSISAVLSLITIVAALFMLCSCNPENNAKNADPSKTINWHDAPFNECDEDGELTDVEYNASSGLAWYTYMYKDDETDFEDDSYAYVSASSDGGFFYALICRKGIGWCLDAYSKAAEDFEGNTYEYNGIKYNLDEPLSCYQLKMQDIKITPCFAYKHTDGKVYVSKALCITKTKNLIKDSLLGDEMTALEGYWYQILDTKSESKNKYRIMPTEVFTYEEVGEKTYKPQYVYDQLKTGTDSYDSSKEGWNKGTISAIVGYFNNGWESVYSDPFLNPSFLND